MSKLTHLFSAVLLTALWLAPLALLDDGNSLRAADHEAPVRLKPVASTHSGLLLQPPVDLSKFTWEEFNEVSSSVGPGKIHKKWTSAVTALPPHARQEVKGLTEQEVKEYMLQVRRLFDEGAANPVSDVGLISTQEDVIRKPMYNHVAAFSNATANVYLLVQKSAGSTGWGYFSIVQDLTTEPPTDYFAELQKADVKFEGTSCYKCHSSGPLAIHPVREDLVSDARLAIALSKHIADQPLSRFHFPKDSPPLDYGTPLKMEACAKCHDEDGDRASLFRVHSHLIRVFVDFGYMPPKQRLTADEIAALKAWLEQKH